MDLFTILPGRELHPKERLALAQQEVRDYNSLTDPEEIRVYEPLLRHKINNRERIQLEAFILTHSDPAVARLRYYTYRVRTGRCRPRKYRFTDGEMSQPTAQIEHFRDIDYYGLYWDHTPHDVQWTSTTICQGCAKWQEHRRLCDQEWLEFVQSVKDKHCDSDDSDFAC